MLFSFQLWLHAVSTSATTDEPLHLLAGERYLQCGDFAFNPEHPPLLKEMAALPLAGMDVRMPDGMRCNPGFIAKSEAFRLGAAFMDDNGEDRILLPARIMASVLSVVLAMLVCDHRLANVRCLAGGRRHGAVRDGAGVGGARFAGHHGHGNHDDGIPVCDGAVCVARLARGARILAMGAAFGLMLASKHSALLVLPLLVLLRLLDTSLFREGPWRIGPHIARPLVELCLAGLIALLVLWAFYGFRYSATPGIPATVEIDGLIRTVGKNGTHDSLIGKAFASIAAARVFPEAYLMGLADIIGNSVRYTRVFGRMYPEGQWFFYPIAFSLKSSIPLLLLLPVGTVALWMDRSRRRQWLFLVFPPLAYLAIAMSSKFTDGIRHVLQVYPYFLLLAGFGLAALWRRGRLWALAVACLLAYQGVAVARTAPDYIPFANAFWGGPARAYDVLTFDSVEWGQSMKRIRTAVDRNRIGECWVAGVSDPLSYVPTRPCKRLPEGRLWRGRRGGVGPVPRHITGTLFLGVRVAVDREGDTFRPALDARREMLAGAIFVSQGTFDLPGVASLAHAMRADGFTRLQQPTDAVRESAAAVRLAPGDPRAWISYGDALWIAGKPQEARIALARADQALAKQPAYAFFASSRLAELRQRVAQHQ